MVVLPYSWLRFPVVSCGLKYYVESRLSWQFLPQKKDSSAMESYVIHNQPVGVIDGSNVVKADFAGDPILRYGFPNYVGRAKCVCVMAGALEGVVFISSKAEEHWCQSATPWIMASSRTGTT